MTDTFSMDSVSWVMDESDLDMLLEVIATATLVVMDLETTGLDEHAVTGGIPNGGVAARIVLASLTLPQAEDLGEPTTWILPLSHPESPWSGEWRATMRRVALAILENGRPLSNHNVKYDARWVYSHTGVDLTSVIDWDTQISSHLLDENSSTKLKERAPVTFGVERWDDFDLRTPGAAEQVPMFDLGIYAARDTYWTWKLDQNHRHRMFLIDADDPEGQEEVEDARLGDLMRKVSMPTTATLTAMEQRGMNLDLAWVRAEIADLDDRRQVTWDDLTTLYPGIDPEGASFAANSHWFKAWVERAIEEGDLRVAGLTNKGRPTWAKNILVRQSREGSEVAARLLEMRGQIKKLEYLRSWLGHVTPDGKIHTNYHAGSVVTGRLSSSGPNLQQVTKKLRPAFVASDGHYIADLDYSQIELRVTALISRSEPMMEAYRQGRDLHKILAGTITGKDPDDVGPDERQFGKAGNFGLVYGMGAFGFRLYAEEVYGVSFTEEEAENIYAAFFETWDGIAQWHARVVSRVHRTGQVTSPIGRVRRLPGVWDGNEKLVSGAERAAINSPVQGMASDLMQAAAASIEGLLPGYEPIEGARLVGTVHDDILVEVPIERWEEVTRQCMDRMLGITDVIETLGCDFDVPLGVEATVGTRWGLDDVAVLH